MAVTVSPESDVVVQVLWRMARARTLAEQDPTAADAHSVAAVLRPRTSMPCFMMTPAPRKPIPDTT